MAKKYWVIGGEYDSTDFKKLKSEETRRGPFASYKSAEAEWSKLSWQYVDQCNTRFKIAESE